QPPALLLFGPVEEEALQADREVRADQDRERRVDHADFLHDPAVGGGREAVAAVLLRDRHPERAELRQARDHLLGDPVLPLDPGRVDAVAGEGAERIEERRHRLAFLRSDLGKREDRVFGHLARQERPQGRLQRRLGRDSRLAHGSSGCSPNIRSLVLERLRQTNQAAAAGGASRWNLAPAFAISWRRGAGRYRVATRAASSSSAEAIRGAPRASAYRRSPPRNGGKPVPKIIARSSFDGEATTSSAMQNAASLIIA